MLFSRDKEDDDDFIPNANYPTNLASIFGGSGSDNSASLTYTAPKQPKRQSLHKPMSSSTSALSASIVITGKTVQTFKMVDGAYQSQGKQGVAVLSTNSDNSVIYQLLLYRDQRHHSCSAKITRDFKFHIQPKNYCTFYDRQMVIWSILFENALEMAEFTFQVALARWKSEHSTSPILFQELWLPIGDPNSSVAAVGDSVELTYTLNTLANTSQEVKESMRVWVEVEDAGWKQALVGVQPTSKRVIIMQPFMLGDLNPKEAVYNCPVVMRLTVVQVNKATKPPEPSEPPKQEEKSTAKEIPQVQTMVSESSSDSPKFSPKRTKADLITRMARMGQALPFKTAAPTPSDSDETEEDQSCRQLTADKAVPKPRSRTPHTTLSTTSSQGAVVAGGPLTPTVPINSQHPVQWAPPPYMVGSMYPAPQLQSPIDSQAQFNMFFSEVRTTNSELRMGLTRLTDKVEALQSKLEMSNQRPGDEIAPVLDKLLENDQLLSQQLEILQSGIQNIPFPSVAEASASISSSPRSEICSRCADMDSIHTSLHERLKKLEEENEYLQTNIIAQKDALQNAKIADKDQSSRIATLESQLEEERVRVSQLNEQLEISERIKESSSEEIDTKNKTITELQSIVLEKQKTIDRLEQSLRESEATKIEEVKRNLQEVLDPKPVIGEHVKKIVNTVYKIVKLQFEPQNKYDASYIQSVLAETFKGVTLQYLENGVQEMSGARLQSTRPAALSTPPSIGQTHSAPSVSSNHVMDEDARSMYVRREQQSSVDDKLPVCTEVSAGMNLPTPKEISSSSQHTELASTEDVSDESHLTENQEIKIQNTSAPENVPDNPLKELKPSVINSAESSDDVWRPQPPPPPLFDEEENDDDWLNL